MNISVFFFKYQLHYFADSEDYPAIPDCPFETFSLSHIVHKSKMCPMGTKCQNWHYLQKMAFGKPFGDQMTILLIMIQNSFDKLSNDTIIQKKGVSEPIGIFLIITKHKMT